MIRQGLGAGEKFRNSIISSGTTFDPSGGMITIGLDSTHYATQEEGSIAIGYNAVKGLDGINNYSQKTGSIAIGKDAADAGQEKDSIAIGNQAGGTEIQGESSIAIGNLAGNGEQRGYAVAIGDNAGRPNQGESSIAIGRGAGQDSRGGKSSIAIGRDAGADGTVGENTIAIGVDAGLSGSGIHSIMIGGMSSCMRGSTPISNSIVLNATGLTLTANANNAFHVAPIRNSEQRTVLGYDIDRKEITYYDAEQAAKISTFLYQEVPPIAQTAKVVAASAKTSNDVPPAQEYQYELIEYLSTSRGLLTRSKGTLLKINNKGNNEISLGLTNSPNAYYNIAITGGPDVTEETTSLPPCLIDMYVKMQINPDDSTINKFTWRASGEYILQKCKDKRNMYKDPDVTDDFGIPLLNPSEPTL